MALGPAGVPYSGARGRTLACGRGKAGGTPGLVHDAGRRSDRPADHQGLRGEYSGIKVDFVPAPWQETSLRIINEARANQVKGDIVDGGASYPPLQAAGLIEPDLCNPPRPIPRPIATRKRALDLRTSSSPQHPRSISTRSRKRISRRPTRTCFTRAGKAAWLGRTRRAWPVRRVSSGTIPNAMGQDRGMDYLEKLAGQNIANVPSNQRVVFSI